MGALTAMSDRPTIFALSSILPPDGATARYLLLFVMWTVAAAAVVLLVPRLAARLDRRET